MGGARLGVFFVFRRASRRCSLLRSLSWEGRSRRREKLKRGGGQSPPLETSAAPTRVAPAFSIDQARRLVPFAVWFQGKRALRAPERPRLFVCQFGGAPPLFRFLRVRREKKEKKLRPQQAHSNANFSPSIPPPLQTLLSSPPPPLPRHRRAPPLPNRRGGARAVVGEERERAAPVEARQFPEIPSSSPHHFGQRCVSTL